VLEDRVERSPLIDRGGYSAPFDSTARNPGDSNARFDQTARNSAKVVIDFLRPIGLRSLKI
jgi:hypothetical protein